MRIRYVGGGTRVWGEHVFDEGNGFVAEVEVEVAAEMLTYPRPQFVVDGDEALLNINGVGPQTVGELALAGIGGVRDLGALDEDGIERLDKGIWASRKQIEDWRGQAREMLGLTMSEEE
jgi:predicted flap endonuclease-1-like 5' DNA nuclease